MSNTPPASTIGTSTECESRLIQAQRELEGLYYAISHDLRAPLRAIAGFSQALQEQPALQTDATSQHYLQRIEQSTQRLGAMIDSLLGLSRLSQADMHLAPVDVSALCAEIVADIAQQFPLHHPRVRIAEPIRALCDPYLIRIALRELLHNAWKFTQDQIDPQIAVEATINHDQIAVCIRDNGIGMDMRYADRLFTPFQHLQTRTELNGTGIGLAKVQRVINRHGGKLSVEASLQGGASFCFSLRSS